MRIYTAVFVFVIIMGCYASRVYAQPSAPVANSATSVASVFFTANWTSASGANFYELVVATNSLFNNFWTAYSGASNSYTVTGLTPSNTYYYRVRAWSTTTGSSSWSNTVQVATTSAAPFPAPVAAAATFINSTSFSANWGSVSGATNYQLDVSTNINFSNFVTGFNNLSVPVISTTVTSLVPGTTYYYRVRAVKTGEISVNSSTITVATATVVPVAKAATNIGSSSLTANWNSVNGASGYRLDVSTTSTFSSFLPGYNNLTVTGTSYSITGIPEKTTIYYRVRAVNSTGIVSGNSNTIVAYNYDQNYIRTMAVNTPGKTTTSQLETATLEERSTSYTFYDGLGRGLQLVGVQGSPSMKDIVQPIEYDKYGREAKKYLPYTDGTDGRFKPDALAAVGSANYGSGKQYAFYQTGGVLAIDQYPYAETRFEASPLNRVIEQGAPGSAWQPDAVNSYTSNTDRTVKYAYNVNAVAGELLIWEYLPPDATYTLGRLINPYYYPEGKFYKTHTKDEHFNEVIEFKDNRGRLFMKKVQAPNSEWAQTYYIYDNYDNLVCVLPPQAIKVKGTQFQGDDATKEAFLNRWAYRYRYDARRRMTIKQVPGADPVYMVYDNRDRLVLTQDGNQRKVNAWRFIKYDAFNRPVLTGQYTSANTLVQMQTAVDNYYANLTSSQAWFETYIGNSAGNIHGYDNKSFPQDTNPLNFLSITYYDKYTFKSLWTGTYDYENDNLANTPASGYAYTQPASENLAVRGMVTGSKVKVLDGGANGGYTWLKSVNYYDKKYRVIQTKSDNYKGGIDKISNLYDFAGKILKTKSVHTENDVTWKDLLNVRQSGNILTSTSSTSGAASLQQLAAGTNGWLEVTYSEGTTTRFIGLNDSNPDAGSSNIDYAFRFTTSNTVNVYENNTLKATVSNVQPGDLFRIVRTGTSVKYYRNNTEIILSLASTPSSTALIADASFTAAGSTLAGVRTSFGSTAKTTIRTFQYDHAGRPTHTWHQLDGGTDILLSKNEYNELGQLIDKKLHSTVAAATDNKQSVDYRYNIRGWLTSMNDASLTNTTSTTKTNDDVTDYFGMNLSYNNVDSDLANAQLYNGNISAMKWSNYGDGTVKQKGHTYVYDAMNRITGSTYKEKTTSWSTLTGSGFAETGFTYDLNGNILTLTRNDKRTSGTMDVLTYNYGSGATHSNKLLKVEDTGDDYAGFIDGNPSLASDFTTATDDYRYDANGNMINDRNKGIGTSITDNVNVITYNVLNLPETVTKSGNTIRYIYDATGRKLAQVMNYAGQIKQTDYASEFMYENDVLKFVNHEEGRIVVQKNTTVFTTDGTSLNGIAGNSGGIPTLVTQNGQTYIKVAYTGSSGRSGIKINGTMTVQAGERYVFRAKGYSGTTPVNFLVRVNTSIDQGMLAALPATLQTESWIEQSLTMPAGASTLDVSLVWHPVATGQEFFVNDIEIIKLENTTPEYQYTLKDHLGNVRLTFTSQTATNTFTAGFETANQSAEASKFKNYPSGGQINTQSVNATSGNNSHLLNGGYSGQVGMTKSFSVMPGDVLSIQASVKYSTPSGTSANYSGFVASLLNAFSLSAPAVGETGTAASGVNTFANWELGGTGNQNQADAMKLFVTIILFDRNYNMIDAAYDAPSSSGDLMSRSYTVKEPGYAYLYYSNEHPTQVNAYFDNISITHTPSPIIQMDDYYPFGLTFNSYQRENSIDQDYKFNGKEEQDELGLNWLDYGARMYDPAIARWMAVDPLAELSRRWSPYNYCVDNPIRFIDPDGMKVVPGGGELGGDLYTGKDMENLFRQLKLQQPSTDSEDEEPEEPDSPTKPRKTKRDKEAEEKEEEVQQEEQDNPYLEINRLFGESFMTDYWPYLRIAPRPDLSESGTNDIVNYIKSMENMTIQDGMGNFMRPVKYQVTIGLMSLRSDSNKYGLIPQTTTEGDILNPMYQTTDPIYGNPGRMDATGTARPVGLGVPLPNGDIGYYYVTIFFQKSYPN